MLKEKMIGRLERMGATRAEAVAIVEDLLMDENITKGSDYEA